MVRPGYSKLSLCLPSLMVLVLAGCRVPKPQHLPPSLAEPHAVLKVRVVHHQSPGKHFDETITIDNRQLRIGYPGGSSQPTTTATRVYLAPLRLDASTTFFDLHTRQVQETYYETVRESCGTESRTTGFGASARTTTSPRYCSRQVQRTRYVTKTTRINRGACRAGTWFSPESGRSYLVQYSFTAAGQCSFSCFEQVFDQNGNFSNQECPRPSLPAPGPAE